MRIFAAFALVALLGSLLAAAPAFADERVSFPTAASATAAPVGITGELSRPAGTGPFPAVVLLHSCLGYPSNRRAIEDRLAASGYVALFVDDFSTRGLSQTCLVDFPQALADAFGALAYLAGRPDIDPARIAAVGFSQGGDTALAIASTHPAFALPSGLGFRAVAAFYPPCANHWGLRIRLPTLILVGAADSVTPAAACTRLAANQPRVRLLVYPGAGHVFDDPAFAGGKRLYTMALQYDQPAATEADAALRDFLAAEVGR